VKSNRFILAISVIIITVFTYSCYTSGDPIYFAIIGRTIGTSYQQLYPNAIMESGGYFLNDNVQSEFEEDMCRYCISNLSDECLHYNNDVNSCIEGIQDNFLNYNSTKEMKNALKSLNTPFYNDIDRKIFVEWNNKFLGFYQIDGQEHYIYVRFERGE